MLHNLKEPSQVYGKHLAGARRRIKIHKKNYFLNKE